MDIFINEKNACVKIGPDDINKNCLAQGNINIKISVVFDDIPEELTIDSTNPTTLANEYLLRRDGTLEIIKTYKNGGAAKTSINAYHPTNPGCADLLKKKNTELKQILTDEMQCDDKTKNAEIRKAIRNFYSDDLQLADIKIDIDEIDAKNTWEQLKKYLPLYFLFQSDRKNTDGDSEVQDPYASSS